MEIEKLIGETTTYDKKLTLEEKKPKSWLKSVSAFANGKGGILFFGIANDDTLVGLTDTQTISEKISEIIKMRMDPIPQTDLEICEEDGKQFIILRVSSGVETPYYYVGDGSRVAFIRVGNESIPAGAVELKRLVLRGSNKTYDSLSSCYPYEKYAFTKLRSVYRQRTGKELLEADFISFGLMDDEGMLTNAGALLADESPLRHSRLFCTRWNGLDKTSGVMEALDDKEYSGSLVTLLQDGERKIKDDYRRAVNYHPELEPKFYSDTTSFWVTLYNLNYHVAIDRIDIGTKKQLFQNEKTVVSKQKQLFQNEKTVVSKQKQLFESKVNELQVSTITKKKIMQLHEQFGNNIIFSRADIMRITGITSSPAGDLIKKMQSVNLIEFVSGYGKGKYRFKENSAN